jgi:hypothetical protein
MQLCHGHGVWFSMQGAQAAELEEAFGGGGIKGYLLEGVLGALQVTTADKTLTPCKHQQFCSICCGCEVPESGDSLDIAET